MEYEFRRIREEQQNSTRKSSDSINSKDELLSNRSRDNKVFISNGTSNNGRYRGYEKEISKYTGKFIKGQYSNERGNEKNNTGADGKSILQNETRIERNRGTEQRQYFQSKKENSYNSILNGIIGISDIFSNPKMNNRPKRKIKCYRTLSKRAMREYAIKMANASFFRWEEDEEEM